jgi:hypothetical protein
MSPHPSKRSGPTTPGPFKPFRIHVPTRLLEAFERLGVEPVLVGGGAVQVWTGRVDGPFLTGDLDFITSINLSDLGQEGLPLEASGRHVVVEGVPVEFPSGPLAVGDLDLNPADSTVGVPVSPSGSVLCLRPEACALDRLTWVAGEGLQTTYHQALGVILEQSPGTGWDPGWASDSAQKAGLAKLWRHTLADAENIRAGHFEPSALTKATSIGWG